MDKTRRNDIRYRKLTSYLNDRIVKNDPNNSNFEHLMETVASYLKPRQKSSKKFLEICEHLKMHGELEPENLQLLKDIFPKERDSEAYEEILKAENEIKGE